MANTYCYILSYNVYIKPGETPVTIDTTAYTDAYTFFIQPEEVSAWSYTNSYTVIKPYNFNTMTVNPKPFSYGFSEVNLEAVVAQSEQE